jgi:hypothetical protein
MTAMFRTPWLNKSKVLSDEGFYVEIGRDWLVYQRGDRRMTMTCDVGGPEINVFTDTANRWDDDPSVEVDEQTRSTILNDVTRALEWRGLQVRLLP